MNNFLDFVCNERNRMNIRSVKESRPILLNFTKVSEATLEYIFNNFEIIHRAGCCNSILEKVSRLYFVYIILWSTLLCRD